MDTNNTMKSYYLNFGINELLSANEILKSMPVVYNSIYYTTPYTNALWTGEGSETFENVVVFCKDTNVNKIRQIIKNNFLYVPKWDSLKFTDNEDYGFSFIVGKVKYILGIYIETNTGYHLKLYDCNSGVCVDTNIVSDKSSFLDTSLNENGDFVRTCQFKLSDMTDANTTKKMARGKIHLETATVDTSGYTLVNTMLIMLIVVMSIIAVMLAYYAVIK